MRELVIDLASGESLDEIMMRIGRAAQKVLDAPYVMVAWKEEGRGLVFHPLGVDLKALQEKGLDWPKGMGVLGYLWDTGEMLRLEDVQEHPASVGSLPGIRP